MTSYVGDAVDEPAYTAKSNDIDEKSSVDATCDYDDMDGDYD